MTSQQVMANAIRLYLTVPTRRAPETPLAFSPKKLLADMPHCGKVKNPALAAALGFLCGGIGLAIYLRTWRDTALIVGLILLFGLTMPGIGVVIACVIVGVYGFVRVWNSNKLLCGDGWGNGLWKL